jgi:endo-1,4-beta-xylanase
VAIPISLAEAAGRGGRLFGAAAASADLDDPVLAAAFARECAILTPEYEMKWDWVAPAPGKRRFEAVDRLLGFAQRHRLAFRGHTPWWRLAIPSWLEDADARTFGDAARAHLAELATRYAGRVHSWDVVNEPLEPAHDRPDGLRRCRFLDAFGAGYVAEAFSTIDQIDQTALLMVNEVGLEHAGPEAAAKRRAMLALLERLLAAGARVDALGLQAHLAPGDAPGAVADFRRFLGEVDALGVAVMITELDVDGAALAGDRAAQDAAAARVMADIVATAAQVARLIGVVSWGISDRKSWLNGRPGLAPARGLPLDARGRRKPAWGALARALTERRSTLD